MAAIEGVVVLTNSRQAVPISAGKDANSSA
jgi:hypothetical protein